MRIYLLNKTTRYIINGLIATAANYGTLVTLIEYTAIQYVSIASILAAVVGITISFFGNRIYVFESKAPILIELFRFKVVYASLAFFQILFMAIWSDLFLLNYTFGFLIATAVSVLLSYFINSHFVFK